MIRERGAAALYVAMGAVALVCAATPFSRSLQGAAMDAQHLTPPSLASWAAMQVTPKMYSLAHRVYLSDAPLDEERIAAGDVRFDAYWLNHYPGRMSFEVHRADLAASGAPAHVLATSSYRGLSRSTAFVSTVEGGRLVIRRRPEPW